MKNQERGMTLIALAVTILLILIIVGIGTTSIISDKGIIQQAQESKMYQKEKKYDEGIQLAITDAKIEYQDKEKNKSYFEYIKSALENMEDFKSNDARYEFVKYNRDEDITYTNTVDSEINALYIHVENFVFMIYEDQAYVINKNENKQQQLEKGTITFGYNDNWTNQNVTITINKSENIKENEYKVKYKINDGLWQEYNSGIQVTENCIIYAKVLDANKEIAAENQLEITKIEKNVPIIKSFSVQATNDNCAKIAINSKIQDTDSGISRIIYYYSKDEGKNYNSTEFTTESQGTTDEINQTDEIELEEETYVIYAELYDRAGNKCQSDKKIITLEHNWKDATCGSAKICNKCKITIGEALGHDFTSKTKTETYLKTPASCTENAVYYYKCSRCDAKGTNTYEDGEASGHDFSSKTKTDVYRKSSATCTAKAVYYYKCSKCDAKGTNTYEDGEALGHSYKYYNSSGTDVGTSHPTSAGTYTYKCSNNCGTGTSTHTVSTNVQNDSSTHYTYKCSCGNCQATANHTYGGMYKGDISSSEYRTYHYYKCSACKKVKKESHNNNKGYSYAYTGSGHIRYKTCSCTVQWNSTSQSCSYTNKYSRTNDSTHMAYCACGHGTSQSHSYPGQYTSAKCSKCGDMYGISGA